MDWVSPQETWISRTYLFLPTKKLFTFFSHHICLQSIGYFSQSSGCFAGLTLEGDSGEKIALWLLTSLCTSAKREVEVAL
jgi:hypothetical protein